MSGPSTYAEDAAGWFCRGYDAGAASATTLGGTFADGYEAALDDVAAGRVPGFTVGAPYDVARGVDQRDQHAPWVGDLDTEPLRPGEGPATFTADKLERVGPHLAGPAVLAHLRRLEAVA